MDMGADAEFREHRLETVEAAKDGSGWTITFDDCLCTFVTSKTCKVAPQPGETLRLYGRGFGYTVRGIVIGGRVYRYRTEAEAAQDHKNWCAEQRRKRAAEYETKREDFDRRVAALPDPLRLRVERFRTIGENEWRYEHESYEVFCCEQAAVIAEAVVSLDGLAEFTRLEYAAQRERVPKLADGHSGNTFGASCQLARCLIEQPDLAPKMHGALCPLVGCEGYGCFAAHEARRGIEA
jgi:hypothetical protein